MRIVESCIVMILQHSLLELFNNDSSIITSRFKEEAINHRLAVYIEKNLRIASYYDLNVDIEYNKNIDSEKTIICMEGIVRGIRPDILIHMRNNNMDNIVAIESKKEALSKGDKYKLQKLSEYPYNYTNCIGIVYKPGKDYFYAYTVKNLLQRQVILKDNCNINGIVGRLI